MRLVLPALLLVAACGRYEFARVDTGADGGDGRSDAPLGDFPPPQLVTALSDPLTDDDPTATADALELYFATERAGMAGGYADIWVSTRASRSDPWGTPSGVAELNTADEDQSPGIAPDGLTIYFSSRRPTPVIPGTSSNIWMATRASRAAAWGTPVLVAELSTTMDEFEPQPDESNLRLVLYIDFGGGNRELYEATRASPAAPWGAPVPLASVNSAQDDRSPCLHDGGRELWFASDRDSATAGSYDIYVAHRATTSGPFDAGSVPPAINSAAADDDPWVSPDGHVLIMSTLRDGNPEIYESQR